MYSCGNNPCYYGISFLKETSSDTSSPGTGSSSSSRNDLLPDLKDKTLRTAQRNGQRIIDRAWQSSLVLGNLLGGIKYRNAEITNSGRDGNAYEVTAKIHYLNVLDTRQYLEVVFRYDGQGDATGISISDWSDVIGPESLSPGELLRVIR
jgi:hypothetical protein